MDAVAGVIPFTHVFIFDPRDDGTGDDSIWDATDKVFIAHGGTSESKDVAITFGPTCFMDVPVISFGSVQ